MKYVKPANFPSKTKRYVAIIHAETRFLLKRNSILNELVERNRKQLKTLFKTNIERSQIKN